MPLLAAQKNTHHTADVDVKKLLDELQATKKMILQNESLFNTVTDPDLIDSVIYENLSLMSRYNHYFTLLKKLDVTQPVPAPDEIGSLLHKPKMLLKELITWTQL
ncbi:MAG: DUF2508 family protein [Oscillospiraceae bacterium]|nr:DUF2508 family protein [Oscillospiraceae bacterium]